MDLDSILTGSWSILNENKKIQAHRVTSIEFGKIVQKFRQNAKITNGNEFESLKTAINAKVSQAEKRIPEVLWIQN